jgi:predicted ATPase
MGSSPTAPHERVAATTARAEDDFPSLVRVALRHVHDRRTLDRLPLSPARGGPGPHGRALQTALLDAIAALGDALRPLPPGIADLMRLRYAEGLPPPTVFRRLGVSQSEYYRQHDRGVAEVGNSLQPQWVVVLPPGAPVRGHPSALVGRAGDAAAIEALLDQHRLVTITGPGGVGKTSLALELAAARERPDGAAVVDLTDVAESARVADAVAAALGAPEGSTLEQALADVVGSGARLVVVDNCEHVVEGAARAIATLLGRCSAARVLATSREALRVPGERVWALQPLAAPPPDGGSGAAEARAYPAVALFEDRAAAADARFALTDRNAAAVAEVCRLLDGVPLALELAAACVPTFSPAQLAGMLDARFALLVDGARTAPPRHRTLRAAVEWSTALLAPGERAVLRRLGVFVGGWTAAAAAAVCSDAATPAGQVLAALAHLVRASLVAVEGSDGVDRRYRMLETIRRYAVDELVAAGEERLVRDRHLAWCVSFGETAARAFAEADDGTWLERVDRDLPNVRAALAWARESRDAGAGARLASSLTQFWYQRGKPAEGLAWIEGWLGADMPPDLRPRALLGAALTALRVGKVDACATYAGECLRDYPEHDPPSAALLVAYAATAQGRLKDGRGVLLDALGTVPAPHRGRAEVLHGLGRLEDAAGDYERARAYQDEALRLYRTVDDLFGQQSVLLHMACSALGLGECARAKEVLVESLAIKQRMGNLEGVALTEAMLGVVAACAGDADAAQTHLVDGLMGYRHGAGEVRYLSWVLGVWAEIVLDSGDAAGAATVLGAAEAVRARIVDSTLPVLRDRAERTTAAARGRLGAEGFERAWQAGIGMTLVQALNYALAVQPATGRAGSHR